MNKNFLKKATRLAAVVIATFTSFGCLAVGCNKTSTPSAPLETAVVNKTPASEAKVYYIGTPVEGAAHDGTSAETPYSVDEFVKTVLVNDNALQPGNIVKVLPGEHMVTERIILNTNCVGAHDDYVIWEAADVSKKTVLNFKAQRFDSLNRGVQIYSNYVYWHGIDVCGAGDNGLYIGGSYNVVEDCEFYNNRDTGLQLGRSFGDYKLISQWPSYNLIKNCTSYNNYDNETYGENADGFAAKLTVGYGNVFDGCIAYRNSDDGWDLYGKPDSGNIGRVIMYNCVAFENGFIMQTQEEFNQWFGDSFNTLMPEIDLREANTNQFLTRDGDGNGFKLGGSTMAGDVYLENCLSFNNRMHGVTDNSNPGIIRLDGITSYNNAATVDSRSHLNIIDEYGETNTLYHSIASDGKIFNAVGKAVIVDSVTHTAKSNYVNLDNEGYILDSDSKFIMNGDEKVKGEHIYASEEGQTVNPTFGHINGGHTENCNNIDIARTSSSYNTLKNVLSVNDGGVRSLGKDRFKGAIENCILSISKNEAAKYTNMVDTDYVSLTDDQILEGVNDDVKGEKITAVAASEIFEAVPANDLGMRNDIHYTCRNEDGSINMGNILKIKDYSKLLGDTNKIGSDLTKTTWEGYNHCHYVYLTDDRVKNDTDAWLTSVQEMLYVPVDPTACYQDFSVLTSMDSCSISWKSSNSKVLSIGTEEKTTSSGSTSVRVTCNRVKGKDTKVTLTATITTPDGKNSKKKSFDIIVKQYEGRLGDIIVEDITEDGYVIRYEGEGEEPTFELLNAADYNGKLLDQKDYQIINKEIYYGASKTADMNQTDKFRISRAGVYEIKQTAKIGNATREYSYTVYVVSRDGDIDFVGDSTVSATHNGYSISGELSNVAGTLYTLVSDSKPTEEQLKSQGDKYDITKDSINVSFEHDITQGFTVYYGIYNPNGTLKSKIYEQEIALEQISTKAKFKELAQSGGDASKIYQLTTDLEYTTSDGWAVGTAGFKGVLDGQGHTISGITVANSSDKGKASVFYRLDGGSVMNINFENISLEGSQDVGIFGQAYSGYLANIRMKNIRSIGVQRIGGLVGHAYEQVGSALIIDNVSLINTDSQARIYGTTSRAGGILGFVQTNSTDSLKSHIVDVRLSNCYVNATIGDVAATGQFGGIVGTYDTSTNPATVDYSMSIQFCVFVGTVYSKNRGGGIIGYQQGDGTLRIDDCMSFGDIYHAGSVTPIVVAEKNASGIFGGYVPTADTLVTSCYAFFEEHNSNYDVSTISKNDINSLFWRTYTNFDMKTVWVAASKDDPETPYIKLRDIAE